MRRIPISIISIYGSVALSAINSSAYILDIIVQSGKERTVLRRMSLSCKWFVGTCLPEGKRGEDTDYSLPPGTCVLL